MSTSSYTEFNLPRNAYAAFDALSLKKLITNRLKTSGVFPDIDYEGSNINGLVDVVAYTYHVLLFYLNQTASDSMFSQAELFENMNKIVSLIGYKPTGNRTATLNVNVSASNTLPIGSYTIPRFSNINVNGVYYSFNRDITFQKSTFDNNDEFIDSIGSNNLLYQGSFVEYPLFTAIGENFEQFTLNVDYPVQISQTKMVDHENIFVYVYDSNSKVWSEWNEISSLYLADNISTVFEKRLNEYGHHEIKFGNNVNGKRLNTGDLVSIFYLESDGSKGVISKESTKSSKLVQYVSNLYLEIMTDVFDKNLAYIQPENALLLKFNNEYASVNPTYIENITDIRKNAPLIFSAQNRAVTVYDYESFVSKNFSNIVQSVQAVSNKDYTEKYLKYFYDIGLERPNLNYNVMFNQISFNDSCDFNNVYLFCLPRLGVITNETTPNQLFFAQKQSIVDKLNGYKMVNQNIVVSDPVYLAFEIGLPILGETSTFSIKDQTKLRITRSTTQIISKDQIKSTAFNIIKNFFSQENNILGQKMDFNQLSFDILNINGVKSIETVRTVGTQEHTTSNMTFIYWNPLYPDLTISSTSQNKTLDYFQFPFFYKITDLINKIEVI